MKTAFHITAWIKRLLIVFLSVVAIITIYKYLLPAELRSREIIISIVLMWAFSAYVVLPRVHRLLSTMYVPDYFVGRSRTPDGLLGDPINLAFVGTEKQLKLALKKAGWIEADPLTLKTTWKMIWTTLRNEEYPNAPFSNLLLFDRKQDLAFQQQVDGNAKKRHHVRLWKTPKNWYLPGGHVADWVAAATYDSAVGLSMFTLQFTHRIDPNIDEERDFLVKTIKRTSMVVKREYIEHFFPPFITRNGGGDRVMTDGSMVIITLKNRR